MTIIALAIGLSITLALIFFNFSVAYTVKLFRTGSVPVSNYLFMLSITIVNTAVVIWLSWIIKKAQKPTIDTLNTDKPENVKPIYYQKQQHNKELIISLAETQRYITLNDIMQLTGLNENECTYLLDELILADTLKVVEQHGAFIYILNTEDNHAQNSPLLNR